MQGSCTHERVLAEEVCRQPSRTLSTMKAHLALCQRPVAVLLVHKDDILQDGLCRQRHTCLPRGPHMRHLRHAGAAPAHAGVAGSSCSSPACMRLRTLDTPMRLGTMRSMSAQRYVIACLAPVSRLYVCSTLSSVLNCSADFFCVSCGCKSVPCFAHGERAGAVFSSGLGVGPRQRLHQLACMLRGCRAKSQSWAASPPSTPAAVPPVAPGRSGTRPRAPRSPS